MSIFSDILAQPAILISGVVAILFIVAAILLAVLPRIKASRARARRRKQQLAARREEMQLAAAEQDEGVVSAPSAQPNRRPVATPSAPVVSAAAAPVAPAVAPANAPAAPAVSQANLGASALNAALSGGSSEAKKEEVTPEMQSLLSSVFSDEENSERQALLLKGTQPVTADEVLTLAKAVQAQLHGEQPNNIVRVKENELV